MVIVRRREGLRLGGCGPAVVSDLHFPLFVKDGNMLSSGGCDAPGLIFDASVAETLGLGEGFGAGPGLIVGGFTAGYRTGREEQARGFGGRVRAYRRECRGVVSPLEERGAVRLQCSGVYVGTSLLQF